MSMIYKCPVCEGSGKVEYNFYRDKDGLGITEECRTCKGQGIIPWNAPVVPYENTLPIYDANKPYNPCDNCSVRLSPNWDGICYCTLGQRTTY